MTSQTIYRTTRYTVDVCEIPLTHTETETRYFLDDATGKNIANATDKDEICALADAIEALH